MISKNITIRETDANASNNRKDLSLKHFTCTSQIPDLESTQCAHLQNLESEQFETVRCFLSDCFTLHGAH